MGEESRYLWERLDLLKARPRVDTFEQKCKRWILENVVASPARSAALGKYFVAAANSFSDGGNGGSGRPTPRRKRLHALYLLHDVLYHTVKRQPGNDDFAKSIKEHITPLFSSVCAFPDAPKHTAKILDLLQFWEESNLFDIDTVVSLRNLVEKVAEGGQLPSKGAPQSTASTNASKLPKEAPFSLPHTHGDPSQAWHDLPAANWLPHLTPNSTKPMSPAMIKPLQLAQGPADKVVVEAVKTLLAKVDRLFLKESNWDDGADLNEMGERVIRDETGEVVGGETYYGWSREFCRKMKDRNAKPQDQRDLSRGRSLSRSRSDSRSISRSRSRDAPHHKRRRLSTSYSRSRSMRGSRSRSRSRTRSTRRREDVRGRDSRSRSPSRYRRSRSPSRRERSRTPSPSRNRTERRFRTSPSPRKDGAPAPHAAYYPPPPPAPPTQVPPPHQMPPGQIPPPPPGYTGPWPPPPPPPFPPGGFPQGWNAGAPPMPWGGHGPQGNYGRGGGAGGAGFRGDWGGRGRGRGW